MISGLDCIQKKDEIDRIESLRVQLNVLKK